MQLSPKKLYIMLTENPGHAQKIKLYYGKARQDTANESHESAQKHIESV